MKELAQIVGSAVGILFLSVGFMLFFDRVAIPAMNYRTEATVRRLTEEGTSAAKKGMPPDSCPYPQQSPEHTHWKKGWTVGAESITP